MMILVLLNNRTIESGKSTVAFTIVMRHIQQFMDGRNGSITLLIVTFGLAAFAISEIEVRATHKVASTPSMIVAHKSILLIVIFILEIAALLAEQFTLQLLAEGITHSLTTASTWWSLYGALVCIILVYVMKREAPTISTAWGFDEATQSYLKSQKRSKTVLPLWNVGGTTAR